MQPGSAACHLPSVPQKAIGTGGGRQNYRAPHLTHHFRNPNNQPIGLVWRRGLRNASPFLPRVAANIVSPYSLSSPPPHPPARGGVCL